MRATEEEAKTKQCHIHPAAIIPTAQTGHFLSQQQAGQVSYGWANCVGSACAHWRWMRDDTGPIIAPGTESPVGYCGLAGRPD